MAFVVLIVIVMFVFVMTIGVTTSTFITLSVMMVLVIVIIRHCFSGRSGFGCTGFCYIFPNSCSGSTSYPGTHYSAGLASNRLANYGAGRSSGGTTDDCACLAVTLGGRRSTYAAAHGATYNRSCLAADDLPDRRARRSTQAAAHRSLGIAVSSPHAADSQHQENWEKIRNFHETVL